MEDYISKSKHIKYSSQSIIGKDSKYHAESSLHNLAHQKNKIQIGNNTHIRGELLVWPYSQGIIIGDYCYVGKNSIIWSGEQIIIGNNVLISHNVTIIDSDSHEIDHKERAESYKKLLEQGHSMSVGTVKTSPIIIEDYAWLSYGVSVLKGVTIGRGSIVAAGSVVTNDVQPFTIVAGNPARLIKTLI